MNRIGHGYDVHPLIEGRNLILGGVRIEHPKGLKGHSDADALLHAICDACLGAAGLGDLGGHFPDTEATYEGIDSRELLRQVREVIHRHRWQVGNIDSTIVAQAPRLAAHLPRMRENIAADLNIPAERVNVKATSTEKLGFLGREEGIAAYAVALLEPVREKG
ncbi:MAG: 2-C-methyl-D-erythritol 2,4-cyclodiphosphate synthase [Acidiferrobacterales bacterium]